MEINLSDRSIAITGASSGIGEATALACAAAGARVALAARRVDRIEALARRIAEAHGADRAVAIAADVGDEPQARAFVERAHELLGGLDALVNNAGVMLLGSIEGADTEEWRRMVHANLFGVMYCTHAALPLLRASGGGDVVNVSSVAGRVATAGSAVYNLTKWGVNAFSEALRQECVASGANVRVTMIEPGHVATELQGHNRPEVLERLSRRVGDLEPLTSEDIANAIVFALGQPPHVAINELLVRPSGQR